VEQVPDKEEWNKIQICTTRVFEDRADVQQGCHTTVHPEWNENLIQRNGTTYEFVPLDVLGIVLM